MADKILDNAMLIAVENAVVISAKGGTPSMVVTPSLARRMAAQLTNMADIAEGLKPPAPPVIPFSNGPIL